MVKNITSAGFRSEPVLKIVCSIGIFILSAYSSIGQSIIPKLWVTDGSVGSIARSGNTIYIAGAFDHVGPDIAFGIPVSKHSNKPDLRFAMPNGNVYAAVPDGNGGWYIGGNFRGVGGQERSLLARINADGSLHPWNPDVGGMLVTSMLVANGRLFVAGYFYVMAGEARENLASFDLATWQLNSWNANVSGGPINAMAFKGNTLYLAGVFWSLGGVERRNLGALDMDTGLATPWNPGDFQGWFTTLAVSGNSVYVGGQFSTLAGEPRMNLGSVDAITGQATSWQPNVGDFMTFTVLLSLVADQHNLYVGGIFSTINGQTRHNLASFNLYNLQLNNWKPQLNGGVTSINLNDGKIYISGGFTSVNGMQRDHVAAFYSGSGGLTFFHLPLNGGVNAMAFNNKSVYLGGEFTSIGGEARKNIAAIDATTGCLLPWNPGANDGVNDLLIANKKLFLSGRFDSIGGQARGYLASFDLHTGNLTSWNPGATGGPRGDDAPGSADKMAIHGNTLFFTGSFSRVGGVARRSLAAVDATSGALKPFNPFSERTDVRDLAIANGRLYICGVFPEVAGQPRTGLASFNIATGELTPWNPFVPDAVSNRSVTAITTWNNTVYIAGRFDEVNGQPRKGLAAMNGFSGTVTDWNPGAPLVSWSDVYELVADETNIYLGTISLTDAFMVFDRATGESPGFHPVFTDPNSTGGEGIVLAILPYGNKLYVGGSFTSVDNNPRNSFAGFDMKHMVPKLLFFTTQVEQHTSHTWVNLKWSTTNDQSLSHFWVERSADNLNFSPVKRIEAVQNILPLHSYDFKDLNPLPATSYYRVRMVSRDNRDWFSATERVNISNGCWVHIYPSPADRMVTVHIKQFAANRVNLVLHNQDGLPVWTRANFTLNNGSGLLQIPVDRLMDGYYVLRISSGNTVETRGVFVQH